MKVLFILCVVFTLLIAAVIYLPWWAFLGLVVVIVAPLAFGIWRFVRTLKKEIMPALKQVAEGMPRAQERLCKLPSNEVFRGNGFAFTLPVPCEVSQTVIDDLEALILKPTLDAGAAQGIIIVSTIPVNELKSKVNDQLDGMFNQIKAHIEAKPEEGKAFQSEDFAPMTLSKLSGERRTFEGTNDGKTLRGETVYLGEEQFSIGWAVAGPAENFERAAERYRELAGLIRRVEEPKTIDVSTIGK
jgi:hypothetical protein